MSRRIASERSSRSQPRGVAAVAEHGTVGRVCTVWKRAHAPLRDPTFEPRRLMAYIPSISAPRAVVLDALGGKDGYLPLFPRGRVAVTPCGRGVGPVPGTRHWSKQPFMRCNAAVESPFGSATARRDCDVFPYRLVSPLGSDPPTYRRRSFTPVLWANSDTIETRFWAYCRDYSPWSGSRRVPAARSSTRSWYADANSSSCAQAST